MRGAILGAAAAAMLVTAAAPAEARGGWRHRHHDRFDAGDFILGAVIGGIVIAAASSGKRDRERDENWDRPRDYGYGLDGGFDGADDGLNACATAAAREAERYGDRDARVESIRAIDNGGRDTRYEGRVDVRGGWDRDRAPARSVRFTCRAQDGRVVAFRFLDDYDYAYRE
jgi:hypothetical protein